MSSVSRLPATAHYFEPGHPLYQPRVSYQRIRKALLRADPTLYLPQHDGLRPETRQRGCGRCGWDSDLCAYALCERHTRLYQFLRATRPAEVAAALVQVEAAELNLAHVGRRARRKAAR